MPALRVAGVAPALLAGGGPPFGIPQPFAADFAHGANGATPAIRMKRVEVQAELRADFLGERRHVVMEHLRVIHAPPTDHASE